MALKNLRDFHDPDLVLTIGDHEYRIPQPSASKGLRIRQLFALQQIGDETELEHVADILGAEWVPHIVQVPVLNAITGEPVLDEAGEPTVEEQDHGEFRGGLWSQMDADGVTWEELMHAGRTALIDVGMGRTLAEAHWVRGLTPYVDGSAEGNALPQKPAPTPVEGNRATRRAAAKSGPKKSKTPKKRPAAD
ncbi:putative tail assembly protein [Gordonia phage GMA1]|uniref:tail assembly chaperone n=1 Tax=Gordonia phage GMA1 TaxID=1647470 RepID=UPI0007B64158|nr:tail assembly chaperone [Gordonia phage GMA1]AKJ72111.1 putative tail assembly protein [Gordonia phage GMA1]